MAAPPGDPGGYFRCTSRFWMGVIAICIGYFAWAVFLPSTIPYENLGQFGHFTKYLVDNHPKLLYNGRAQVTTESSSAQITMQADNRKRAPAWTVREILDLITIWGEDSVLAELRSKRRNAKTFEKISKGMMERGRNRDSEQCRVKVKELRQAYQKTKEANGRSASEPQTCRFYAELRAILGGAATTTPPLTVDSEAGVISSATPEESADGEEEEDELAESTQHSVLPNSQDLFLSLTEVPSQPYTQDHDPMEGTSAANFSSLPPPSRRLSQIRRRRKRT
ncbi:transmembrane protein 254 isoform X2 [Emys orbicularis]|uniref:transmembrane protein 254 isoform X2 n=1 Tax=Emys orbicularis TaxID=82168 RepID=UPI0031FCBE92